MDEQQTKTLDERFALVLSEVLNEIKVLSSR
jgi:hypothetical protein